MTRARMLLGAAGVAAAVAIGAVQADPAGGHGVSAQRPVSAAASTPRCRASELHASLVQVSPGLTHRGYVIDFRNRGRACTITGYPGVDVLAANGHRIVSARRTRRGYLGGLAAGAIPTVRLARGWTASAIVEWIDLGPPCPRARWLEVTPPNSARSVLFSPRSLKGETLCAVEVHPVVRGSTGRTA